jgi:hypothetical protein
MYTQFTISNNMTANGFRLHLGGNRDYTGVTDPPGFTCRYDTEPGPTFYYVCLGNVMANATYSGTFDSSPSPAAGMGGTVEFTTDGAMTWSQPFTITGP